METFLIILLVIIGIIIIGFIIKKLSINTKSEIDTFKEEIQKLGFKISKVESGFGDLEIIKDELKYRIKLLRSEKYAEVSINNISTFEIKYGGSNDPGKPHPFHKLITNINLSKSDEYQKVIVVLPRPKKIVMWINENEIVFVTSSTKVYGSRIISIDDLSLFK